MIDNPFNQTIEQFNLGAAFAYLNPEYSAFMGQKVNQIIKKVTTGQIQTDIDFTKFPENFNYHLFVSQNIANVELIYFSDVIKTAFIVNNAVYDDFMTFIPIFQYPIQLIDNNKFKVLNNLTLNFNFIQNGTTVKIRNSLRNTFIGKVSNIDYTDNTFDIEFNDLSILLETNSEITYTLVSVQVCDIERIAYIIFYRQYLTNNPNIIYDTQIEFNYELYQTLYPETRYMDKNEAYLNYIYYIGINNPRIGKAADISIDEENLPDIQPLDTLATADIDVDTIRAKKLLSVPENATFSVHGIDLYYTTSNSERHSKDVIYNGLITEKGIKGYIDHKFDNYAQMNDVSIQGETAFAKSVFINGESNYATNMFFNNINVDNTATFTNLNTIGLLTVDGEAIFNKDINAYQNIYVSSNVIVNGEGLFSDNISTNCNISTSNNVFCSGISILSNLQLINGNLDINSKFLINNHDLDITDFTCKIGSCKIQSLNNETTIIDTTINIESSDIILTNGKFTIYSDNNSEINKLIVVDNFVSHCNCTFNGKVLFDSEEQIEVKPSTNFVSKVYLNNGCIIQGDELIVDNTGFKITNGSSTIDNGNINIYNGNLSFNDGAILIDKNGINIEYGQINVDSGIVNLSNSILNVNENIINDKGITINNGDLNVSNGRITLDYVFNVDPTIFEVSLPLNVLDKDVTIKNGSLILDNIIISNTDIVASNINCTLSNCSTNSLNTSNIQCSLMNTDNIYVVNEVTTNNTITNYLSINKTFITTDSNIIVQKPIDINANLIANENIIAKSNVNVWNNLYAKTIDSELITSDRIEIVTCKVLNDLICDSNLTVTGQTNFKGKVVFSYPNTFQASVKFIDNVNFSSNVFFNGTTTFNNTLKVNKSSTFDESVQFNKSVNLKLSGATFDEYGFTCEKRINTVTANINQLSNNYIYCKELGEFESAKFNDTVVFNSNAVFMNDISFIKPLTVVGINVTNNMMSTSNMTLFKQKVYIDDTLLASNISIQNDCFVNNLIANTLQTSNIAFKGDLLDIKKDINVRNKTITQFCTVSNVLNAENILNVKGNSYFYGDAFFDKKIETNQLLADYSVISNGSTFHGSTVFNKDTTFNNNVILNDVINCNKNATFYNGIVMKNGTCLLENATTLLNRGKTILTSTEVDNITVKTLLKAEDIHVSSTLSVIENILLDGTLFAYNINITNDIKNVNNIFVNNEIVCSKATINNSFTCKSINTDSFKVPDIITVDLDGINCERHMEINTLTAKELCIFKKGIHIENSMFIDSEATFRYNTMFKNTAMFYDNTFFTKNVNCGSNVIISKDLYVDGNLYLAQSIDLQRNITLVNMIAKSNVDILNQLTSSNATVNDTLAVKGNSLLTRVGIGGTQTILPASTIESPIVVYCDNLAVSNTSKFNKKVTIGTINTTNETMLTVNGILEGSKIVQTSDNRVKYNINNISDEEILNSIDYVSLKRFKMIENDTPFIGILAQDLQGNELLKSVLSSHISEKTIKLKENRHCQNISSAFDIIKISDGKDWFLELGQKIVLKDGRIYEIINCDKEEQTAVISPPLDVTDQFITITSLVIKDLVQIDMNQLLTITLGMCSSLYKKINKLESILNNVKYQ